MPVRNPNARLTPAQSREQLAALKAARRGCCYHGCTATPTHVITRGTGTTYPVCADDAAGQVLACLELGGTFTVAAL